MWELLRVPAGEVRTPGELPDAGWRPTIVPGGVGDPDADAWAWWLRRTVAVDERPHELLLDGIGTYAEIFLDDAHVASTANAFRAQRILLDVTPGEHMLAVRIAALSEIIVPRKPRARWRSALLPDATMRWHRSPHLGRIPSWQGAMPYVGIVGRLDVAPAQAALATVEALDGVVVASLAGRTDGARLRIGTVTAAPGEPLVVPDAARWSPTHPATYALLVEQDGHVVDRRVVGFSDLRIDGTTVTVDGEPFFVRGACWVPTDAATWRDDPARVRADLTRLRATGFNAVRITGTNRYEPAAFWDLAAELGLLVWQDVMLATFDPPEDPAWLAELDAELRDQLGRLQGRPNVLAVCGGTETEQQPTLMGLPVPHVSAIHDVVPQACRAVLPRTPHVASSPSGGPLPVSVGEGFSHYFGVGAYLRPLDDARSARVAFASEALAFAIPAERASVARDYPGLDDVRREDWRDGIPSDRGVDWGFDDVTDHYVTALFGVRRDDVDADRWLDLERAAVTDAMTSTLSTWRSATTPTAGAFVLAHTDLRPGPGWGLLDHRGHAKAPLLALREVLAPTALLLVDHGLDGLTLDVAHEGGPLDAVLHVEAYAAGDQPVLAASVPVTGPGTHHVEQLLGGFRDLTYAWRFGERYYTALHARLVAGDDILAETTRLLGPPQPLLPAPALTADATLDGPDLVVTVTALRLAELVHVEAPGWEPDIGWFHLAPGRSRVIRCRPTGAPRATVTVRTTNAPPLHRPASSSVEATPEMPGVWQFRWAGRG